MNVLTDKLPVTVVIWGVEYAINANFRTSILFNKIIDNDEVEEDERILGILKLYYPHLPQAEHLNEAIEKIMWFYRCGKEIKETKNSKSISINKILSYEHDAEYIYSGFLEQYSIDLQKDNNLHWWKFKALFDGLREDTQIKKIMCYRSIDLKEIKDEKQKEFYKDMKEAYKLPVAEKAKKQEDKILNDVLAEVMKYQ